MQWDGTKHQSQLNTTVAEPTCFISDAQKTGAHGVPSAWHKVQHAPRLIQALPRDLPLLHVAHTEKALVDAGRLVYHCCEAWHLRQGHAAVQPAKVAHPIDSAGEQRPACSL